MRLAEEKRHEAIRRYVSAAADVRGREPARASGKRERERETREARCERERRGGILSVGVMCPGAGCSLERGEESCSQRYKAMEDGDETAERATNSLDDPRKEEDG